MQEASRSTGIYLILIPYSMSECISYSLLKGGVVKGSVVQVAQVTFVASIELVPYSSKRLALDATSPSTTPFWRRQDLTLYLLEPSIHAEAHRHYFSQSLFLHSLHTSLNTLASGHLGHLPRGSVGLSLGFMPHILPMPFLLF